MEVRDILGVEVQESDSGVRLVPTEPCCWPKDDVKSCCSYRQEPGK